MRHGLALVDHSRRTQVLKRAYDAEELDADDFSAFLASEEESDNGDDDGSKEQRKEVCPKIIPSGDSKTQRRG